MPEHHTQEICSLSAVMLSLRGLEQSDARRVLRAAMELLGGAQTDPLSDGDAPLFGWNWSSRERRILKEILGSTFGDKEGPSFRQAWVCLDKFKLSMHRGVGPVTTRQINEVFARHGLALKEHRER